MYNIYSGPKGVPIFYYRAQVYTIELHGAFGYVGLRRNIGEWVCRKRSFGDDVDPSLINPPIRGPHHYQ